MKDDRFVLLLGRTSDDPSVVEFLKAHDIEKRPKLDKGLFDAILLNHKKGLEITFTDERHLDVKSDKYEDGDLVLSNIRFYGEGHKTFKPYTGPLPLGLSFKLDRKSSQELLGRKPDVMNKDLGKARWDFKEYCVFLTYNKAYTEIGVIAIQLPLK